MRRAWAPFVDGGFELRENTCWRLGFDGAPPHQRAAETADTYTEADGTFGAQSGGGEAEDLVAQGSLRELGAGGGWRCGLELNSKEP